MEITGYNPVEKSGQNTRTSEIERMREAKERDDTKNANANSDKVTISEEAREQAVTSKEDAR